jgi:hypothetical protein
MGTTNDWIDYRLAISTLWRHELTECPTMVEKVCFLAHRNARSNPNR